MYMSNNVSIVLDVISQYSYLTLIKDGEIIACDTHENHNNLSDSLIEYINDILVRHNFALQDLYAIYLVTGPGKFSAMRIGATVAKTLCLLNQSKLYIIDKFDYLNEPNGWVVVKSDGNKSFICHYQNNQKYSEPQLVDDKEVSAIIGNELVIYESNNQTKVLSKLSSFKLVDHHFMLEYLKKPC